MLIRSLCINHVFSTTTVPGGAEPTIRVVAVVNDVIVVDVPETLKDAVDKFVVEIVAVDEQQTSKRQTKEPIVFAVEYNGQPWINIPPNRLSSLTKGTTYTIQVRYRLL